MFIGFFLSVRFNEIFSMISAMLSMSFVVITYKMSLETRSRPCNPNFLVAYKIEPQEFSNFSVKNNNSKMAI